MLDEKNGAGSQGHTSKKSSNRNCGEGLDEGEEDIPSIRF